MGLSTKKIAEIRITTSPRNEILEEIRKYFTEFRIQSSELRIKGLKPLVIFTPNPEIINFAQKDQEFRRIVNSAQINLPDGAGVVWALRKLNGISVERISGVDFMLDLCNLANSQSLTVGLIGGKAGVALKTKECLLKKYPGLKMDVFEAPEIRIQNSEFRIQNYPASAGSRKRRDNLKLKIIDKIIKEKIDILFVGLGFPKQEYFISNLTYHLSLITYHRPLVLMAVGGSFDYISGRVPRAPLFIRNLRLEWLFRLILEPWRLPRQLKGAEFFYRVFMAKPR